MIFISLTRLRIRSIRFLPFFAVHTLQALQQVKKAAGFQTGLLLPDRDWTYWTMTAWDSQESMRQYMTMGPHKKAMPHLMNWCDEASVAHWNQEESTLPTWEEADRRMRDSGRASKVCKPSSRHASLTYREPRTSGGSHPPRVICVRRVLNGCAIHSSGSVSTHAPGASESGVTFRATGSQSMKGTVRIVSASS